MLPPPAPQKPPVKAKAGNPSSSRVRKQLPVKEKPEKQTVDPKSLVGKQVEVYWPKPYDGWFEGIVDSISQRKGSTFFKVFYHEDGVDTSENHHFDTAKYRVR